MISFLLIIVAIYLLLGFVFAILFVITGVEKIDEGAKGAGLGFRLIIVPGSAVFWPLLLKKWIHAAKNSSHDQVTS